MSDEDIVQGMIEIDGQWVQAPPATEDNTYYCGNCDNVVYSWQDCACE